MLFPIFQLEPITEKPTIHYIQNPFPELFANHESEQFYLDYAYSTELFERCANTIAQSTEFIIVILSER
jgi:hypothetical protein